MWLEILLLEEQPANLGCGLGLWFWHILDFKMFKKYTSYTTLKGLILVVPRNAEDLLFTAPHDPSPSTRGESSIKSRKFFPTFRWCCINKQGWSCPNILPKCKRRHSNFPPLMVNPNWKNVISEQHSVTTMWSVNVVHRSTSSPGGHRYIILTNSSKDTWAELGQTRNRVGISTYKPQVFILNLLIQQNTSTWPALPCRMPKNILETCWDPVICYISWQLWAFKSPCIYIS